MMPGDEIPKVIVVPEWAMRRRMSDRQIIVTSVVCTLIVLACLIAWAVAQEARNDG